ncbi:MAG: GNAT family N-acetyltransferase [Chloroflexi bacterium]|nr:GNAT family N-acetyltransferase [Chloroflexota bacterium]
MSVQIRPAQAADQQAITHLVRQARINPMDLNWRRFIVADDGGQIVATGQVRRHFDGSRELASIATAPSHRGRGIAGDVIRALIAADDVRPDQAVPPEPLFLLCRAPLEPFYARFGFRVASGAGLPPYFRLMHWGMRLWDGRVMVREDTEHE